MFFILVFLQVVYIGRLLCNDERMVIWIPQKIIFFLFKSNEDQKSIIELRFWIDSMMNIYLPSWILTVHCPNYILKSLYLMLIAKGVYIAILEDPAFDQSIEICKTYHTFCRNSSLFIHLTSTRLVYSFILVATVTLPYNFYLILPFDNVSKNWEWNVKEFYSISIYSYNLYIYIFIFIFTFLFLFLI